LANNIDQQTAVKCVLGEYESGSLTEMTATAEALLNRGTTKGVYGCNAVSELKGVYTRKGRVIPSYAVKRAVRAVKMGYTSNLTNKATHWEAIGTFKRPYWADRLTETAKVGQHTYFR